MRKAILLKIIAFTAILIIGIEFIALLFYPYNEVIRNWQHFYFLEKNSVDILIAGSSHAYASFDPSTISEKTGKSVYILGSNTQNINQTYFNIKEILKYQTPKMIIFEAFSLDYSYTSNDDQNCFKKDILKNHTQEEIENNRWWAKESNVDGMRFGLPKLGAIYEQYIPENWAYALLKITRCHNNWKEPDIIKNNMSFLLNKTHPFSFYRPYTDIMSEETMLKYAERVYDSRERFVTEKSVYYFYKLAELCQNNNIELYVIMSPMYDKYIESFNYNSWTTNISEMTKSKNVPYLDCNLYYNEIGLTAQDFSDEYNTWHHVNKTGAEKVTNFAAEWLNGGKND